MPRDANWHSMCDFAEAGARMGTPEQIARLRELIAPYERLNPVMGRGIGSIGPMAYWLGRLAEAAGDTDEAVRLYEWTIEWCEGVGARPRARMSRERLELVRAAVS
jgi:hypothetical protein